MAELKTLIITLEFGFPGWFGNANVHAQTGRGIFNQTYLATLLYQSEGFKGSAVCIFTTRQ